MTRKKAGRAKGEAETETAMAVTATPEPAPAESADAPETAVDAGGKRAGGNGIAWLSLLLSVVVLAAFAYDYLSRDAMVAASTRSTAEIASLRAAVNATRDSLTTLQQSVSALSELDATRIDELDALQRRLNTRLQQLEMLPARISGIEDTVSSLQGVSSGARDAWLLAETEYYMQIANAQLQLAGNPHLATLALTMADERIMQLTDPGLVPVRRALANELRALKSMHTPDTEGITLTLATLANSVDELPLRHEVIVASRGDAAIDGELTGVDRAMASLKNALGDVVSVRRADENVKPLMAPEAQYFLRQNLALTLQTARLALLRNEESIFLGSLVDAAAWLDEYFDTGSTAVQNTQQAISDIRGSVFTIAVPDISESLRLLRQFDAFSRANGDAPQAEEPSETPPDEPAETEPVAEPQQ
jgi:uncharacterized protein HemX